MGSLRYFTMMSLDGFIEDANGRFEWAEPDETVHAFVNDLMRDVETLLYGRRMYEVMATWETEPGLAEEPVGRDFAELWIGADKIVYSTTLEEPWTARTRLERTFDADAARAVVEAANGGIGIGGPALAEHAFAAGLVDEVQVVVAPVLVGSGKPGFPPTVHEQLELVDERRFESGMVFAHFRVVR